MAGFGPSGRFGGCDKVCEMDAQSFMIILVIPLDCGALDCLPVAPFSNCFRIDTQLPAQLSDRSLRSLYCSSDCERGRGAPMTNLSHNAFFHS
jgi:hypothetical protein